MALTAAAPPADISGRKVCSQEVIVPLTIEDPEAEQLARALAQRTGETLTQAVIKALRERLAREERRAQE